MLRMPQCEAILNDARQHRPLQQHALRKELTESLAVIAGVRAGSRPWMNDGGQ